MLEDFIKQLMEDENVVPVRLAPKSLRRLIELSEHVGAHPARCAEQLLHDILEDDETFNVLSMIEPSTKHPN